MTDDFRDIPVQDAVTILRLDQHFSDRTTLWVYDTADQAIARIEADPHVRSSREAIGANWRDLERERERPNWVVRHYSGDAALTETIDLDEVGPTANLAGIVVDGDLKIGGSVINWESELDVPFIVVRGNLRCNDVLVSCADLTVKGDVFVSNLFAITDNHAWVDIGGNLQAKTFVMGSDGWSRIGGSIDAAGWNASINADLPIRSSNWVNEVKDDYRREFIDAEGYADELELYRALLAGRDILNR